MPDAAPATRAGPWEPSRPWRVGQSSFLRPDLSQNFFQDLEAKRPSTGPSTIAYCPRWPRGPAGVRVRGLAATPDDRNQIGFTAAYSSGREHKLGMLNHTEMHSDNKMRKRGREGGLGDGGGDGEEEEGEGEGGKGGKNEPEKLSGKVKKTKRQTRKHSFVAHLEKMQVTNE